MERAVVLALGAVRQVELMRTVIAGHQSWPQAKLVGGGLGGLCPPLSLTTVSYKDTGLSRARLGKSEPNDCTDFVTDSEPGQYSRLYVTHEKQNCSNWNGQWSVLGLQR